MANHMRTSRIELRAQQLFGLNGVLSRDFYFPFSLPPCFVSDSVPGDWSISYI